MRLQIAALMIAALLAFSGCIRIAAGKVNYKDTTIENAEIEVKEDKAKDDGQ